jgi:succinoglycan biosynthesis protein ExoA
VAAVTGRDPAPPAVSFVVATWQEAAFIGPCLERLLAQDLDGLDGGIEVLVADGGSTDGTRELVEEVARRDPRVRLLDNPRKVAPAAFNLGIAASRGRYVSLVGAHSLPQVDYARRLVAAFEATGAWLVGGRAVSEPAVPGPVAAGIARAMASPLGVGGATFRLSEQAGWADTGFPGAYRRALFDEIGVFDELLVRNQDDDLHLRARLAGHRLWYEPALATIYHPRSTLRSLWRQYEQYGFWRAATLRKHRRLASPRQAAPGVLVAGLALGPLLGSRSTPLRRLWAAGTAAWLLVVVAAGVRERKRGADPSTSAAAAAAVAAMHLSYGAGFWRGAWAEARTWAVRTIKTGG